MGCMTAVWEGFTKLLDFGLTHMDIFQDTVLQDVEYLEIEYVFSNTITAPKHTVCTMKVFLDAQ